MPEMYIIAGCNGAGKTTASYTVLPDMLHCKEFVNADEIARGLSPFNPESVAIEAGKIMLARIADLLDEGADFAFETTLATRTYLQLIHRAHERGYRVSLLFFWLDSADLAVGRVATRVAMGGHSIPESTIRRRYDKGLTNLFHLYMDSVDYWMILDNSPSPFQIVAESEKKTTKQIYIPLLYQQMQSYERRD